MFKVIAKQDYKDKRAELIEEYKDKEIKYDELGNALVEEGDIYIISNPERAKQIEESGLAVVIELKEEREKKEETKQKESEKAKTTNNKEIKKTVKRTRKKKGE